MEGSDKIDSPQAEIEALRRRIAELELFASGQPEEGRMEVQSVKEAIKEHIQNPAEKIAEYYKLPEKEIESHAANISALKSGVLAKDDSTQEMQKQVLQLMQLVESKGIYNTISVVEKINDPYLQDSFHDVLIKYLQGLKK